MSDGEYISLGYHEKDDVVCLVEYLKKRDKTSKVGVCVCLSISYSFVYFSLLSCLFSSHHLFNRLLSGVGVWGQQPLLCMLERVMRFFSFFIY